MKIEYDIIVYTTLKTKIKKFCEKQLIDGYIYIINGIYRDISNDNIIIVNFDYIYDELLFKKKYYTNQYEKVNKKSKKYYEYLWIIGLKKDFTEDDYNKICEDIDYYNTFNSDGINKLLICIKNEIMILSKYLTYVIEQLKYNKIFYDFIKTDFYNTCCFFNKNK